jgi:hypothetical protein
MVRLVKTDAALGAHASKEFLWLAHVETETADFPDSVLPEVGITPRTSEQPIDYGYEDKSEHAPERQAALNSLKLGEAGIGNSPNHNRDNCNGSEASVQEFLAPLKFFPNGHGSTGPLGDRIGLIRLTEVCAALGTELHNRLVNFQAFGPEIGIALWAPKIPEIVNSKTNADGNNRGENQPHSDLKIDSADDKDDHSGGHKQRAAPFNAVGHAQSFLKVFGDCHGAIRRRLGDRVRLVRFDEADPTLRTEGNKSSIHLQVRRLKLRVAFGASKIPREDTEHGAYDDYCTHAIPAGGCSGRVQENQCEEADHHGPNSDASGHPKDAELFFEMFTDSHGRESYRDAQGAA